MGLLDSVVSEAVTSELECLIWPASSLDDDPEEDLDLDFGSSWEMSRDLDSLTVTGSSDLDSLTVTGSIDLDSVTVEGSSSLTGAWGDSPLEISGDFLSTSGDDSRLASEDLMPGRGETVAGTSGDSLKSSGHSSSA